MDAANMQDQTLVAWIHSYFTDESHNGMKLAIWIYSKGQR